MFNRPLSVWQSPFERSETPMISIILKVYNGEDTLAEALDSLVPQCVGHECEIILSDNGSTDRTREIFTEYSRRFAGVPMRIIDASQRRNKSYALNTGIREAQGERLLFLDADDTVAPGWLEAMARALVSAPLVAARIDAGPLNPEWIHAIRPNSQDRGLDTLSQEPFCVHAGGATLGFHRHVFEAVGDFDETMKCLEDTDFCIRAHLQGFTIAFVPNAVYNYRYRHTLEGIQSQARDYAQYLTLLRKRYANNSSLFVLRPWLSLGLEFIHLGAEAAGAGERTLVDAARFHQRLGAAKGELIGALAYRVAPRRRSLRVRWRTFGGMLRLFTHLRPKAPDMKVPGRAGGSMEGKAEGRTEGKAGDRALSAPVSEQQGLPAETGGDRGGDRGWERGENEIRRRQA